jgi:hypothetical protein
VVDTAMVLDVLVYAAATGQPCAGRAMEIVATAPAAEPRSVVALCWLMTTLAHSELSILIAVVQPIRADGLWQCGILYAMMMHRNVRKGGAAAPARSRPM